MASTRRSTGRKQLSRGDFSGTASTMKRNRHDGDQDADLGEDLPTEE
jgi:hypothetical protein